MKKSYSKLNILGDRLAGKGYKGIIDYFATNKQNVLISIAYYDYLRGKIFIDDMKENFSDVPFHFNVSTLVFLLYTDFMSQVKKGAAEHKDIANFLLTGKKMHFHKKQKETRIMKNIGKNLFAFETEFEDEENEDEYQFADLHIKFRQSEILRGEILLHDLEEYLNGVTISFEDILIIRYLNFISEVKEKGNSINIQKAILNNIS